LKTVIVACAPYQGSGEGGVGLYAFALFALHELCAVHHEQNALDGEAREEDQAGDPEREAGVREGEREGEDARAFFRMEGAGG
jgi:hypothetical protein